MKLKRRVAVFASGGGSNLGAILDHLDALGPAAPAAVALVVSNREGAGALARASARGIPAVVIADPSSAPHLLTLLEHHAIDLVVLAGYLRLIPREVVERYEGRVVNVHPALLPKHGGPGMYGARVHRAVLAAGDRESGATVHFVDAEFDRGKIIATARVPVEKTDTPESLAARILVAEHFLYPRTLHLLVASDSHLPAAEYFANPPSGVTIDAPRPPLSL